MKTEVNTNTIETVRKLAKNYLETLDDREKEESFITVRERNERELNNFIQWMVTQTIEYNIITSQEEKILSDIRKEKNNLVQRFSL